MQRWREVASFDPRASRATYLLLRCTTCGTAVTGGRAGDEAALYRGGSYRRPRPAVDRVLEPLRAAGERATIRRLGVAPGSTVLEVGAGDGRLLRRLRERGCTTIGVEPYANAGAGIVSGRLEDAGVPAESVDLALVWHVLEHVDDPAGLLAQIFPLLRPGGRLVVGVPRLDSLQAQLGGAAWFHLDVPRHATHFTAAGLEALLGRTGYTGVGLGGFAVDQNLLGMTQTLLNRGTSARNAAFRLLKGDRAGIGRRDAAVSALGLAPALVAGPLLELGAAAAGRGGTMIAEARRS